MLDISNFTEVSAPWLLSLNIEIELLFFDRPMCFLFRDLANNIYLGHFLDYEKETKKECWYLLPIRREIIPLLLSGKMGLLSAIATAPENMRMVAVTNNVDSNKYTFSKLLSAPQIEQFSEYLPNKLFHFFDDEFSDYMAENFDSIEDYAYTRNADIIDLHLQREGLSLITFPLSELAAIIESVQRIITNLAFWKIDSRKLGQRGLVPNYIENGSKFALLELKTGSVKLRLESIAPSINEHTSVLPETDYAHIGTEEFLSLINNKSPQLLCEKLLPYPARIKANFISYVCFLKKNRIGLDISWASRWKKSGHCEWDIQDVTDIAEAVMAMKVIQENTYETTGFFISGAMQTGYFKFYDIEKNRIIEGHIEEGKDKERITLSLEKKPIIYRVNIQEQIKQAEGGSTKYINTFLEIEECNTQHNIGS